MLVRGPMPVAHPANTTRVTRARVAITTMEPTLENLIADYALADGLFAFDLVRVDDMVAAYGVTKMQAKAFLVGRGAIQMTRYCQGLHSTGLRPVRLWAIRNIEAWKERGPKGRTLDYFASREAA